MRNIKLKIQYDGTDYHGWQIQKNDITVQETVKKAVQKIVNEDVHLRLRTNRYRRSRRKLCMQLFHKFKNTV